MFGVDWATMAAIIVALAAVAGIIIQAVKREKPWKKAQSDHNIRLTSLEDKIDHLKEIIDDHDHRDEKDFERLENKIEKLTDITISILQNDATAKPKAKPKPRSTKPKAKK